MKRSVKLATTAPSFKASAVRLRGRQGAGIVDRHREIRLQLDLAGGDDHVAFLEPVSDRHALAAYRAETHEASLDDEIVVFLVLLRGLRIALFGRRRLHDENVVAIERINDRRARQGEDLARRAAGDVDLGEHAGKEFVIRVGNLGPDQHVARVLAHPGVDRRDLAGEGLARQRIDAHMRLLPDRQYAQRLLRRREVGIDRIELLQRDHAEADRDILADIDPADAEPAGEGRDDFLLGDDRLGALDGRRRRIARREGGVHLRLGGVAADDELLLAVEPDVGVLELRHAALEIGLIDGIVDIDDRRAGRDILA